MAVEFTVRLENRPGTLAHLAGILGDAGINLDAVHQMSFKNESILQFIPSSVEGAAAALEQAGIVYARREVVVVNVLDQPGTLGEVALVMADAGINIDSVYQTYTGAVILGVDDIDGAVQVTGGMAVRAQEN